MIVHKNTKTILVHTQQNHPYHKVGARCIIVACIIRAPAKNVYMGKDVMGVSTKQHTFDFA